MTGPVTKKSVIAKALSKYDAERLSELLIGATATADAQMTLKAFAGRLACSVNKESPKDRQRIELIEEVLALCSLVTTDNDVLVIDHAPVALFSPAHLAICLAAVVDNKSARRALENDIDSPTYGDIVAIALGRDWITASESPVDWVPL